MPVKKIYNSRIADKFVVRLPDGWRDKIAAFSRANHRSMNSHVLQYLDTCMQLEDAGIPITFDALSTGVNVAANPLDQTRIKALEAMLQKLLDSGTWFTSTIEMEHGVYASVLEAEVVELLSGKLDASEFLKAFIEADADPKGSIIAVQGPRVPYAINIPVMYEGHLWIVTELTAQDGTLWADLQREDTNEKMNIETTCKHAHLEPYIA